MTIKRNLLRRAALICVAVILVAAAVGGSFALRDAAIEAKQIPHNPQDSFFGEAENVIFMIGDGMGANHIRAGAAYCETDRLFMESAPNKSFACTASLSSGATDSAASATALSTGTKVYNGNVAKLNGTNLQTMTEYAKSLGKGVGVIATETLTGATPAGFTAHAVSRNNTDSIRSTQLASGADLLFGAAKDDWVDYEADVRAQGYEFCTAFSQLSPTADKLFAAFDSIAVRDGTDSKPTLAALVEFAVGFLSAKYPDGYFLMVEGSHIDKRSHSNDMQGMVEQLQGFDDAVRVAANVAVTQNDTAVIVTADHETGGLQYSGETAAQLNDDMFTRGSHSTADVPVFVFGNVQQLPPRVDNTELCLLTRKILAGNN